jgi:hypothetical protein
MLALAGCNSGTGDYKQVTDKDTKETPAVIDDHHHDHGPHGGHVLELGEHHGEIALEADRKLTLYVLDGDVKNAVPLAETTALANLKIGTEMQKIDLKALPLDGEADGKSSRYQSAGRRNAYSAKSWPVRRGRIGDRGGRLQLEGGRVGESAIRFASIGSARQRL